MDSPKGTTEKSRKRKRGRDEEYPWCTEFLDPDYPHHILKYDDRLGGQEDLETLFQRAKRHGHGDRAPEDQYDAAGLYRKAAEEGHLWAQMNLGVCYAKGLGVNVDQERALELFKSSAEDGYTDAQYQLGCFYMRVPRSLESRKLAGIWFGKAGAQGHPMACRRMGHLALHGAGNLLPYKEAVDWIKRGAERGDMHSVYALAVAHLYGLGTPEDPQEGIRWLRTAVEKGHGRAASRLAFYHRTGKGGLEVNPREALRLYRLAADLGDHSSMGEMGMMYLQGEGVRRDAKEAEWCFRRAHEAMGWKFPYIRGETFPVVEEEHASDEKDSAMASWEGREPEAQEPYDPEFWRF